MNEAKELDDRLNYMKSELLSRLYAKRHDESVFANTPFRSPKWEGLNDLRPEAQEAERKHREEFGDHIRFWDDVGENGWRLGLELASAIDAYRTCKYKNAPDDEYKKAEAHLIKLIETAHEKREGEAKSRLCRLRDILQRTWSGIAET